jgi:hypothetical protein
MFIVPKAFPEEFRRDVVAVARKGEAPITKIANELLPVSASTAFLIISPGPRPSLTTALIRQAASDQQPRPLCSGVNPF